MEKMLAEFVHYLRKHNIAVSTASIKEMVKVLPYIDYRNQEDFQCTLKQIFLQEYDKEEKFDLCFQSFFVEEMEILEQRKELIEIEKKIEELPLEMQQSLSKIQHEEQIRETKTDIWEEFMNESTSSLNESENMKDLLKEWANALIQQNNRMLDVALIAQLKEADIQKETIESFIEELTWKAIESNQPSLVFDAVNQLQRSMTLQNKEVLKFKTREQTLLNTVEKTIKKGKRKMITTTIDKLQDAYVQDLSLDEVEELREHIRERTQGLMSKFSKLLKQSPNEQEINIGAMIEKSVETYGIPMELCYESPKKNHTNIDVLLDISGSVIKNAELLLMFIYLLKKKFPHQVRVFVFVGLLVEVSEYMETDDWEEMLETCLRNAPLDYRGYSDYNRALSIYEEKYLRDISKDSLIFMMGDARNNANDARLKTAEQMKKQAKAVYWLNPDKKKMWNQGDSVIGKYAPYSNAILEATTAKQMLAGLDYITQTLN